MSEFKLPTGNWLLVTGIALILLGIGAILAPAIAGGAVVYIIGSLLLVTGLIQFFAGWREDSVKSKFLHLMQGAIIGIAGIAILGHPFYGLAALSLVLTIFFVIDGVWKISLSFSYRPGSGWLAMLASGVIAVLLGVMIWSQWPVSGLWAVGILVGVDLLSTGFALITLALTWKQAVRNARGKVHVANESLAERVSESEQPA